MEYFLSVGCLYFIIVIISGYVMRYRAGAGIWHRLQVFGERGFGPGWIITITVASLVWPVTLILWLARGRPEPRIVFNEKAAERRRAAQS